ncbi:hypothetical protein K493DRAFT_319901 [Basidiobolus meristosporus CBS 931.73]|uniref:Cyclin N-terminal domain-containing protein n=1 Tax=Basidiobolus meristosporus CBS 931.73 TaxID=1314790 RepID=A0A1Y1XJ17_9FUNG|nr:hypothetical protein K493DRAFT_319901 [Basidiobolus meristosporus CBS 931.73]|eukprot:ORX85749.1 hypothetical protein K493DRAFT_319901 [Basidiobolus meristosporus CBS 931.73]
MAVSVPEYNCHPLPGTMSSLHGADLKSPIKLSKSLLRDPDALMTFAASRVEAALQCEKTNTARPDLPSLEAFVKLMTIRTKLSLPTIIVSLVYVERLHKSLPPSARGDYETPYKIFLAAVLSASKFLNDRPIENCKMASLCDGYFTLFEINEMERCFLSLIGYQLFVDSEDVRVFLNDYRNLLQAGLYFEGW